MCVCVCVCEREIERQRDRRRDRETERQKKSECILRSRVERHTIHKTKGREVKMRQS